MPDQQRPAVNLNQSVSTCARVLWTRVSTLTVKDRNINPCQLLQSLHRLQGSMCAGTQERIDCCMAAAENGRSLTRYHLTRLCTGSLRMLCRAYCLLQEL